MSGTKLGGLKAAATNKKIHGSDFYARIGAKGGKNGHTGGFAANPTLASLAGAKGGRNSKRGPAKKKPVKVERVEIPAEVVVVKKRGLFGRLFRKDK